MYIKVLKKLIFKNMKAASLILFTLLSVFVFGQYCPALGPDQILPCGVTSTTLTADLSQCGAGNNPNQTTNYTVSQIPYVPQVNTGALVQLSDDSQTGPFNIGFSFCFYGQTYNQFWIGSNGWISFSPNQPTTFTSQPIPNVSVATPKNCIMGPWQDWHPGVGGQIRYQVQGVAPCRKLVVSWINMPMFLCTSTLGTFHIVIYESTNYIENHIAVKPNCIQWQNGTATQGIHNLAGNAAVSVPGRNSSQWTAQQDARRYTPSGAPVLPTLVWYQVGNPVPIASGVNQITVTPPQLGAQYTCHLEYPSCNAGWSTCNAGAGLGPDTVFVQPGAPNLNPPTIQTINPTCYGYCDGSVIVTPTNGTAPFTYVWNINQNTSTISNLCSGNYNVTITDNNGCNVIANASLIDPPQVVVGNITSLDTICYLSSNETYSVPSLGVGYSYNWSSTGNITSGQGTNSITVDWSTFPAGLIPGAVNVVALNQSGCSSLPQDVDIFILNVLPTIDSISPLCDYSNCVTLTGTPIGGVFTGNGLNGNTFCPSPLLAGTNTITYTYVQSNCTFDTTINIIVYPRPSISQIQNNLGDLNSEFMELCEGDSINRIYTANSPGGGNIVWILNQDSIMNPSLPITWNAPGTYTFSAVAYQNGCVSYPTAYITTIQRCPEELIYIPNTFTPDGDEYNNNFLPIFTNGFDPQDFHLTVYNRWGEVMFESYNSTVAWDGTYNNTLCQDGVYIWTIKYGDKETDKETLITGNVTLIK